MTTRMERYHIYRNEIINEGIMLDKLATESNLSSQYKTKIDKLDPNILKNININQSLAKLISINENEYKESETMTNCLNLIDEKKISNINDEINEWKNQVHSQNIIDANGNISKNWLSEDPTYNNFLLTNEKIKLQNNSWTKFQENSKTAVVKMNELSTITDSSDAIERLRTIETYKDTKKNYNKIAYIVPSILSIATLIAIIVILVIVITRL